LALFLLTAGFKKKDLKYAVALGLSTALVFSVFARVIELGFLVLMATVLSIPYFLSFLRGNLRVSARFVGSFLVLACLTAIATNLFWVLPFLGVSTTFYAKLVTFPLSAVSFESQFTTIQNVLRLQGYWPFFVGNYVPYASFYNNPIVWVVTFALPVVVIGGLLSAKTCHPETASLGILMALFLALSLGTNLPLNLFTTLVGAVPFFKPFKDPWIFLEPLALVYAILFGISIAMIAGFKTVHVNRKYLPKITAMALVIVILGTISWPVLSGAIYVNWYKPSERGVTVPPDYEQLNNWVAQQGCGCATMILPELSGSYVATTWGFQGPNDIYQNLFSTRLITGSGPAIYGLQPSSEKHVLDYVYTLMSSGDPLFSPTQVNATSQLRGWHFSVDSQAMTDSIISNQGLTPWNQSALGWNLGPLMEGIQNGHSIYFTFNTTQNLSNQRFVSIWASSTVDSTNLVFGVEDSVGNVGWYSFESHVLFTNGQWSLLAFPLTKPDARSYDFSRTKSLILNYGLFSGQTIASAGNGTLRFGPISFSSGDVPENLIQFLLASLNVRYVILDQSLDRNLYPQLDVRPYQQMLSSWPDFALVKIFGNLFVYENDRYGSLISAPQGWIQASDLYLLPDRFRQIQANNGALGFIITNKPNSQISPYNATVESVSQTGPTSFTVRLSSKDNFVLVLSTAFDPGWQAFSNGRILANHILVDGYANGWFVSVPGEVTLEIRYQPQTLYGTSLWLSFLSIVGICAALVSKRLVTRLKPRRPPSPAIPISDSDSSLEKETRFEESSDPFGSAYAHRSSRHA
jgi:hypothetical protein